MAILTFVMFTIWGFVRSFMNRPPGDYETEVCDIRLKDKKYDQALEAANKALNKTPNHRGALMCKALVFISEKKYTEADRTLTNLIIFLEKNLEEETESRKKTLSQKKSSEVRLGNIAETLAPFLDQFDFDPENCIFLGRPIDYISFEDEVVTLIEVKSGKSQLNTKQRHIRDLIKNKQVAWKEIRIQ